jgi:hypothetical protein
MERKVKDMAVKEIKRVCELMGWSGSSHIGNLSAQQEDSFPEYFKLIKVISHDQDEKKEKKDRELNNKEVMSSLTTAVLKPTPDSVKKRSIDEALEMKAVSHIVVSIKLL